MKRLSFWIVGLLLVSLVTPGWSAEIRRFRGEAPSKILMQTLGGATCLNVMAVGQAAMSQRVTLSEKSHLFVQFTFEWGSLNPDEEGLLSMSVDGQNHDDFEWSFVGNAFSRTSSTVTWSFDNVREGTHMIAVGARLEGGDLSAELNECALTVFVIPSD